MAASILPVVSLNYGKTTSNVSLRLLASFIQITWLAASVGFEGYSCRITQNQ
jgi:hypothetical protein